jgi:hypothetical protein
MNIDLSKINDDQDFEEQIILGGYGEDAIEAALEAWTAVKAARALDEELASHDESCS